MSRNYFAFVSGLLVTVVIQAISGPCPDAEFETVHSLTFEEMDHHEVANFFLGTQWLESRLTALMRNPASIYKEGDFTPTLQDKSIVRTVQKTYGAWVEEKICPESPYIDEPVRSRMTSRYGRRVHPISGRRHLHAGIDYRGQVGTPVYASSPGKVTIARRKGAYGKTVVIDHGNRYTTLYGHLSDYAVKEGQWINMGQTVGYIGQTGRATGPHLHFEVRCHNVPVNPLKYLGNAGLVAEVKTRKNVRALALRRPAALILEAREETPRDPNYYTRQINQLKLENLSQAAKSF